MQPSVAREAWVEWDFRTQRWVIARLFDAAYCHKCETDTTLIEHNVVGPGRNGPTAQSILHMPRETAETREQLRRVEQR